MLITGVVGPSRDELRPMKDSGTDPDLGLPGRERLTDHLAASGTGEVDDWTAYAMSVCSAYAYAKVAGFCETPDTVARMMSRLGLESNRTLLVADQVDAMFIVSSAVVVQSEDGRVVIVGYRGTEPFSLANWFTDIDTNTEKVPLLVGDAYLPVHAGFYRNVRATRSPILAAVQHALAGRSILDPDQPVEHPMQALYITGHSLGGAMAAIMGLLVLNDEAYEPLRSTLRSVVTFGQPMVGSQALVDEVVKHDQQRWFHRFVYDSDVVAQLPPIGLGDYAHFGTEYVVDPDSGGVVTAEQPRGQAWPWSVAMAPLEFLAARLPVLKWVPFQYSLDSHLPVHYMNWLRPVLVSTEYGDYARAPGV